MAAMYQRTNGTTKSDRSKTRTYLVGGGIASLASAVYLIREGHLSGKNIHIFEESELLAGSHGIFPTFCAARMQPEDRMVNERRRPSGRRGDA
jgi:myosin-crossreactive antigen